MKPKVFISSTYLDLIPFREELRKNLTELEIEILGMEVFGARKEKPLETCLMEVDKCDIYIGILAFKYGSIEKETGKSFTQLEYEKAVEGKKEILIYLFDEEGLIQPKFIEFGENADKLISFKKYLKELHTIDTFKTPVDLSNKINGKLRLIIPSLPNIIVRPQVLETEVNRIKIGKRNWIALVSFFNDKPFEIFTILSEEDYFPIPNYISKGKVIEVIDEDKKARYDFVFVDKHGYTNTFGGINHIFRSDIYTYNNMLNTLLKRDVSTNTIKELVNQMDISGTSEDTAWKKGVLKALKIK